MTTNRDENRETPDVIYKNISHKKQLNSPEESGSRNVPKVGDSILSGRQTYVTENTSVAELSKMM